MNHEQWMELTGDEKRIKVAELCGWKFRPVRYGADSPFDTRSSEPHLCITPNDKTASTSSIPDYLNDLNASSAMHDVLYERGLFEEYVDNLGSLLVGHAPLRVKLVEATAEQRAEAFVITMTEEKQ